MIRFINSIAQVGVETFRKTIRHVIVCCLVYFGVFTSICIAQSIRGIEDENCNSAVVLNGLTYSGTNINKISYLSLINQETFEQLKKSGSMELAEWLTGSYQDFQNRLSSYFSSVNLTIDTKTITDYAYFYLSDNAVSAYAACVEAKAKSKEGSLHVWVDDVDRDIVVATVYWNDAPGDSHSLPLKIITAGVDQQDFPSTILPDQKIPFIFVRKPGQTFAIVAQAGAYGTGLKIPPHFRITEKTSSKLVRSEIAHAYCPVGGASSKDICVSPGEPGWYFKLDSAMPHIDFIIDGRGTTNPHPKTTATITSKDRNRICLKATCYPNTRFGAQLKAHIEAIAERVDYTIE